MKLPSKLLLLLLALCPYGFAEPFFTPSASTDLKSAFRSLRASSGGSSGSHSSSFSSGFHSSSSSNKCRSKECYIASAVGAAAVVIIVLYDISRLVFFGIRWYRRVKRARQQNVVVAQLGPQRFTSSMLQYGFPECSICLMK